jgi:hypothetical protein
MDMISIIVLAVVALFFILSLFGIDDDTIDRLNS